MRNFRIANVLDTELTCYPDGIFPEGQVPEIIDIGLVEVNLQALEIQRCISIQVVPVKSMVSPFCTELTGWTYAKLLKCGVPFKEACRRLTEKYASKGRLLVTDSNGDVESFKRQCPRSRGRLRPGIHFPFGEDRFNVSTLFSLVTGQEKNLSLEAKLEFLGMKFEGTPHRAVVDATNIARLWIKLLEITREGVAGIKPVTG
jgi:inhibitor of KinA sporulation pathway (predicted exonuclease)